MSTSWRDDPALVRDADEDLAPDPELTELWSGVFDDLVPAVLNARGGRGGGIVSQAIKLLVHQARKYVARNPDKARATVIEAMRMVAAQLRVEPAEVYGDRG